MTGVEMIRMLKKNGFTVLKVSKSSHYHMTRDDSYVIVPPHRKELGEGLYNQILEDAKLK